VSPLECHRLADPQADRCQQPEEQPVTAGDLREQDRELVSRHRPHLLVLGLLGSRPMRQVQFARRIRPDHALAHRGRQARA